VPRVRERARFAAVVPDYNADPQVVPYLLYEDAGAAMDWLIKVFGFTERVRDRQSDGTVRHRELVLSNCGVIMLGSGVAEAGLDALAGDLDTAAAGDPPLNDEAGRRQWLGSGEVDALKFVPLAGRDRAGAGCATSAGQGRDRVS
jgi:hypothetical protein